MGFPVIGISDTAGGLFQQQFVVCATHERRNCISFLQHEKSFVDKPAAYVLTDFTLACLDLYNP